ncbi:MAG: recombination-associated protein RdgC [Neisseriaceae bacterium]|nr:recombination-associated protein RdgC [Neisseriaceae bacterium]
MWFKQLKFFVIDPKQIPDTQTLSEALSEHSFTPIEGLMKISEGFEFATSFNEDFVFSVDGSDSICLKKEERILPASAINELVAEKIKEIENKQARSVGRKERQQIKDDVIDDLIPRALSKTAYTHLIFARKHGFILVDRANANQAENVLSHLRESLGSLNARTIDTVESPTSLMTQWLLDGVADGSFELDQFCELKSENGQVSTVRISGQDLSSDEVIQHVKNGKNVTQLGLIWQDKISFVLSHDFSLKKIRFLDILQEDADESDDLPSLTASIQLLMSENLCVMLKELIEHLGGLTGK